MNRNVLFSTARLMILSSILLTSCDGEKMQQNKVSENTVVTPFGMIQMDGDIIAKQDVDKIYTEFQPYFDKSWKMEDIIEMK